MISIIICSYRPEYLAAVSESIGRTVGVPHEIVVIDNRDGSRGICRAYNEGVQKSRYELLCFCHEDMLFHSTDWGKIVEEIFLDSAVGLLGIIGSRRHPAAPGSWWDTGSRNIISRVLQQYPDGSKKEELQNPGGLPRTEALTVDGLWFCSRKSLCRQHPFDEKTFPGFHFYDIDFSLQIAENHKVIITTEILSEHFSLGNLNREWMEGAIKLYKKHRKKLPLFVGKIEPKIEKDWDFILIRNFTTRMIEQGFPPGKVLPFALRSAARKPSDRQHLWFAVWLFRAWFPGFYGLLKKLYRSLRPKAENS